MSTSAYYNFIARPSAAKSAQTVDRVQAIEAHRGSIVSPSSFATSSSNSSSSLNQFSSLTQTSSSSSSSSSSTSSSASSTSDSSSTSLRVNKSCATNAIATTTNSAANFRRLSHQRDLIRQSSITPTELDHHHHQHHHHASQLLHSYTLQSLKPKPFKPFKSNSEYLEAMKEDLAEWLNRLYSDLDLTPENFFAQLETGSIICRHANNVTLMGRNYLDEIRQQQEEKQIAGDDDGFSVVDESNNNNNSYTSPSNSIYSCKSYSTSFASVSHGSSLPKIAKMASDKIIDWYRVKILPYKQVAQPGTFFARDNICQFILWCRSLNIFECLLFETDDLVARKNEKSFILCLLEVARIGFKVGMPTPLIIQLEQEIDREIEHDAELQKQLEKEEEELKSKRNQVENNTINSYCDGEDDCKVSGGLNEVNNPVSKQVDLLPKKEADIEVLPDDSRLIEHEGRRDEEEIEQPEEDLGPKPQVITNDLVSLHEKVVQLLCQCTCPTQFPMVRVGDNGKYKVGDKLIIFVRILRRHIMVRVGGGWQELSEFLSIKDPCRSKLCQPHTQQHFQQNQTQFAKLSPSSLVPKAARLEEKYQQSNKGQHHHSNHQQFKNTPSGGGQRLISGSASMSWLSHDA